MRRERTLKDWIIYGITAVVVLVSVWANFYIITRRIEMRRTVDDLRGQVEELKSDSDEEAQR